MSCTLFPAAHGDFAILLVNQLKTALVFAAVREHTPGAYDVRTGGGMYFPLMLQTASAERWRHLSQLHEVHDRLFPQLRGGRVPSFSPVQPAWEAAAMAPRL